MNTRNSMRMAWVAICVTTIVLSSGLALAQSHGGGGAGAHGGYGHASGGYGAAYGYRGGYHGGYGAANGYHGGYYGGYRPVYGYHGGYYGGGYVPIYGYRGGYYGGWGAFGLGVYVASLPYYYSTYWWGGVPYYYANNVYYRYDDYVGQYEKVAPPSALHNQDTTPAAESTELFAYPKNGQSNQQQARDKDECKNWASAQNGLESAANAQPDAAVLAGYLRAQTACLEGRGYSVK
jgi:hypothetical protein